jgi:hypothetical protein
VIRENDNLVDEFEAALVDNFELVDCPLEHLFAPGVYIRSILMEAGQTLTSRIHNTEHAYIVSQGLVNVFVDGEGVVQIKAPAKGITKAGTRRVLHILETTIWSTIHVLPFITGEENSLSEEEKELLIAKIDSEIIEQRENKLLGGVTKCNKVIKQISNNQNY